MITQAGATSGLRYLGPLLVAVILIPVVLGGSSTIFNDGDVSWHIATGRWIIDNGAIPRADPFSFTWGGRPWVPIEWGAEVIYAAAYALGGYGGVAAIVTLALMLLHGIVFVEGSRFVRPLPMLLAIVAMDVILIPTLLARPHVLAWPLLAFWTVVMLRARDADRAPPLAAALLMWLWANLHGSFVLGMMIAALLGLEALIRTADRGRVIRQWGLFGAASLVAILLNANGVAGLTHPFHIVSLEMLPLIQEWKRSTPSHTPWFYAVLLALILLMVWRRPDLPPVRAALLLLLLLLAFEQQRQQGPLAIVAALILPRGYAAAGAAAAAGRRELALLAAAAVVLVLIRLAMPMTPAQNEANPRGLIAAVPPQLRAQPVLNGYSMGGPLILAGIRPYVDGRGDMYGDGLVTGFKRIVDGDTAAFEAAVERWGISWTMLPHRHRKLIAYLDSSPRWRRHYADSIGVIHVRADRSAAGPQPL